MIEEVLKQTIVVTGFVMVMMLVIEYLNIRSHGNWSKWLENWDMTSLKIKSPFLDMEWKPSEPDKKAAWELYIELLTRITTQPLPPEDGVEQTALDSVYSLFPLTRDIIKRNGRGCAEFTKLAIVVLNQIVRPFTARWHRLSEQGAFKDPSQCQTFRQELTALQTQLTRYTQMLGAMAGVEDWTKLDAV